MMPSLSAPPALHSLERSCSFRSSLPFEWSGAAGEEMMLSGRNSRHNPFTASQWQELEHQALIFKYMVSGSPIPPDLIIPIKRSCLLSSTSLYHQPNMGWGYQNHQLGFGSRRGEDPEPGRCRRTDGKKWRCSKEAYPDSKYCERHMHRGKNRSRKHVELSLTATPTTNSGSSLYSSTSYSSHHHPTAQGLGIGLSTQTGLTHFSLDSGGSSSSDRHDYRYMDHQYGFLSDASGRDGPWRFTPLGMSSLGEHDRTTFDTDLTNAASKADADEDEHCHVVGTDFKLGRSVDCDESQKPAANRYFGEWSSSFKSKEPWMDMEGDRSSSRDSKTQLSISIPMAQHDSSIGGKSRSCSSD